MIALGFILLCTVSGICAEVLVSDTFDGSALSPGWVAGVVDAKNTIAGGSLHLAADNTGTLAHALIERNTDSSGNTMFGTAAVYDYYDHELVFHVDLDGVGGSVSGTSRLTYFLGVCDAKSANNMFPFGADNGVFIALDLISTGYRIVVYEAVNKVTSIAHVGYLTGAPTSLELTLNGNNWMLTMEGATLTQGRYAKTSGACGAFTKIQAADFSGFNFSVGLKPFGDPASPATMDIGRIEIITTVAALK